MDPSRYYHLSIFLCKTAAFDSGSSISWSVTDGLARLSEVLDTFSELSRLEPYSPVFRGTASSPFSGFYHLFVSKGLLPEESFRAISTARLNTLP